MPCPDNIFGWVHPVKCAGRDCMLILLREYLVVCNQMCEGGEARLEGEELSGRAAQNNK